MKKLIKSNPEFKPKTQPIFHHWQHSFTSHSLSFQDDLENNIAQHYIKTSYWMPERPDLQSVIYHEIAHCVIRQWLGNLSPQTLDSIESDFCLLLKQIYQCCDVFGIHRYTGEAIPFREITVDLLATAVAGPAYLYALFLEGLGGGLEDMFAIEPDHFEVGLIDYLESVIGPYSHIRDWYYRLHIVCTWLQAIDETDQTQESRLCGRLIDSCKEILEGLHDFLEFNVPPKDKHGDYWRTLKKRLCEIVEESKVVSAIKKWRIERKNDYLVWNEFTKKWEKGECKFPHFTRRLHPSVQNFLIKGFVGKKIALLFGSGNLDEEKIQEVKEHVKNKYGLDKGTWDLTQQGSLKPDKEGNPEPICKFLFEQVYDIPWQCAFFRGLDFVITKQNSVRPTSVNKWLKQMHEDAALGRELYQLGLDFYIHDTESARPRLLETIHVLDDDFLIKNLKKNNLEHYNRIITWKNNSSDEQNKLIEKLKKTNIEYLELVKRYKPRLLLNAFRRNDLDDSIRLKLIKAQGFKLKELFELLSDHTLRLMSVKTANNLVDKGCNLVIVALIGTSLHIRIFDANGKIVDKPESELTSGQALTNLKEKHQNLLYQESCLSSKQKKEIIRDAASIASHTLQLGPKILTPLQSFLEIRDTFEDTKFSRFHNFLFQAFSKEEIKPNQDVSQWNGPDTYLISRICTTDSKSRYKVYAEKRAWSVDPENNQILDPNAGSTSSKMELCERYQVLLGRYDILTIRKLRPMCRYGIPQFPCLENEDKLFLNNFTRREMALPVRLGEKSWDNVHKWDGANEDHNIFALISIKLNQHARRLDFLYRLLKVTRGGNSNNRKDKPKNLDQLEGYIYDSFGDCAFLTDGWGDILLILGNQRLDFHKDSSVDKEVECLKDIFTIQSVLFDDFQVDRTELILTPKCLNYAVRRLDLFSVMFQFRLIGDYTLESVNDRCVKSVKGSIKELGNYLNIKFDIYRVPGRMDYMIRLKHINSKYSCCDNQFFDKMLKIFDNDKLKIDRLQTTIGINVSEED